MRRIQRLAKFKNDSHVGKPGVALETLFKVHRGNGILRYQRYPVKSVA